MKLTTALLDQEVSGFGWVPHSAAHFSSLPSSHTHTVHVNFIDRFSPARLSISWAEKEGIKGVPGSS